VSVNFHWLYFKTRCFKALADRVGLAEQRKLRIYMRPIVRGNVRQQANILINRDGGGVSVEFKSGHNGEYEMKRRKKREHMDLKCPCIDTTMQPTICQGTFHAFVRIFTFLAARLVLVRVGVV